MANQQQWLTYARSQYARLARQYLKGGRRVLKTDAFEEIRGSELIEALGERYQQTVLCDLAYPALHQGAEHHRQPSVGWVQTPVQCQPFATGSFDAVVSFSTLDHFADVNDIGRSLNELARITRPAGQLLISLDNGANPLLALRNLTPNHWLRACGLAPYEYGRTLGPKAFAATLTGAGWRIQHFTDITHEPRALAILAARYSHAGGWLNPARFARLWRCFDGLEHWPTRYWTGYFLLAVAERL